MALLFYILHKCNYLKNFNNYVIVKKIERLCASTMKLLLCSYEQFSGAKNFSGNVLVVGSKFDIAIPWA
jgi:hypothetical protein